MEIINLANRKEVEVNVNGTECIVSLTTKNITHFQENNKMGLAKALEKMNKGDLPTVLKLIYSMISDKNTGRILGRKFFKDYDEMGIIQAFTPIIQKLISEEMPQAKNEKEKK